MEKYLALVLSALMLAPPGFACSEGDLAWKKVAETGSGCFPPSCTEGKYPMATLPLVGFGGNLYSIDGDRVWISADGLKWRSHSKTDWGNRFGTQFAYFKDRLWMLGGMTSWDDFRNDVWSSRDGINWEQALKTSPWKARRGHGVVVFKNKLWLLGGDLSSGRPDAAPSQFIDDVWSTSDGIHWTLINAKAPWSSANGIAALIFDNKIWVVGAKRDVWSSPDGNTWTQITPMAQWDERIGSGVLAYNGKMWIFGGRELNDVWSSSDGKDWKRECTAPWSTRSANYSVVFRDRIWLFSGKTGREDSWDGAIWTMGRKNDLR